MTTLARPTDESVSHFVRGWIPGTHRGLDYGWATNADIEVKASVDGVVSFMQYGFPDNNNGAGNGWGNYVKIDHGNGVVTGYAHLKRGSILPNKGDRVKAGQVIALMGNSGLSGGRHLHFELWLNGTRVDPEPYRTQHLPGLASPASGGALSQLQRVFSKWTYRRSEPTSQSAPIVVDGSDGVAAGVVGNFTHWTRGEYVNGTDIWLKGVSGGWFHASGLERGQDVTGLIEVVPPTAELQPFQRVVRAASLNERREANTASELLRTFKKGEVLDFKAWKRSQTAEIEGVTSDIWVQGRYSGTWFSLAGFTSQSTDGLEEVKEDAPPVVTPPPVVDPGTVLDTAYKSFPANTPLAKWIGSPNYNYRDPRPAGQQPTHITMHWMDGTLAGTDATFQNPKTIANGRGSGSASTYGVGQTEIHQYVREQDYQQADGHTLSNRWGLSIEHEGGTNRSVTSATMQLSARLLADIAKRYGWTEYRLGGEETVEQVQAFNVANPKVRLAFPHKHWVATSCPGTLDIPAILKLANVLLALDVPPVVDPPVVVPGETAQSIIAAIEVLLAKLSKLLGGK